MITVPRRSGRVVAVVVTITFALVALVGGAATAAPTLDSVTTIAVGSTPWGMAVTPDGTEAYVANNASNSVSVIDTTTNTVASTISLGAAPYAVAITPDASEVWVTNPAADTISIISTATNMVTSTISVASAPLYLVFNSSGTTAWVTVNAIDSVQKIDVRTQAVITQIPVGAAPVGIALSADGSTLFTANMADGSVSIISASSDQVTSINNVSASPVQIALSADGRRAFVTDDSGTGNLYILDLISRTSLSPIYLGSPDSTGGVTMSRDGSTVFVGLANSGSPSIVEVDALALTVQGTIPVDPTPTVIVTSPTSSTIYATAQFNNTVNVINFVPEPTPIPTQSNVPEALASTGVTSSPGFVMALGAVAIGALTVLVLRRRRAGD